MESEATVTRYCGVVGAPITARILFSVQGSACCSVDVGIFSWQCSGEERCGQGGGICQLSQQYSSP